ncbi:hypothetical protein [Anaeromassilibacillus senegalensis]|uniref:hypothetical protein n=1 Tax=Anaeromassilibacillus senegalensis TaxID=1673717 RepID=UPI00067FE21E|nr:hypothetical protein [Anaeromassilibacillus senegalensis]
MIIRQLSESRFEWFHRSLMEEAHAEPLDAGYTVKLKINGAEYDVKLQPEDDYQIAVLQALRIERNQYGPDFTLITEDNLLSSFLEILLYQGIYSFGRSPRYV